MPDPYPDGGPRRAPTRPQPEPRRGARHLVPLLLATAFLLVVVLAAVRGDDGPTLVASQRPGSDTDVQAADPPDTDTDADTDTNAGADTAAATERDDADVLGTAVTPTPAPTPTVRVEDLPMSGSGEFVGAPGAAAPYGTAPYRRFAVAVETDIGIDVTELAAFVDSVLGDERSWIGDTVTGFERVGTDEPVDFTLVVATPDTVDRLCAPLQTAGRYSCATNGWVALNLHRWMTATPDWPASLDVYRHYLVNHEVGHYILGGNHDTCPEPGALAPIMMQQTIDLAGCRPNGWVYPRRS